MHDDVEPVPAPAERVERTVDLRVGRHVARQDDIRSAFGRAFFDALLQSIVQIGERERRALAMHGFRDAPGDGALARDADDQRALTDQETHDAVFSDARTDTRRRCATVAKFVGSGKRCGPWPARSDLLYCAPLERR
jgi:hypothetical protein